MADVAIVGAAGYTGQETLDRVLGHPELRLVAVGSDSLAGQGGAALDPRLARADLPAFVTNADALATPADVTILAPDLRVTVSVAAMRSKSKNTPFDGWQLKGAVVATIVGGRVVYRNDAV